jgi:hypothetical protein
VKISRDKKVDVGNSRGTDETENCVCVCVCVYVREREFSSGWCWCRRKVVTLLGVSHISRTRPSERSGMKIRMLDR